ncbi:MAG: T9SS type A sorting domain-containing protein [Crocinitomicaceae bacterium]
MSPISSIAIQDLSGKTVMVYEANNSNEITINVQEMTAGIYTLTVHVENKTLVKKLIIQ